MSLNQDWYWGDMEIDTKKFGDECGLAMLQEIAKTADLHIDIYRGEKDDEEPQFVIECQSDVEFKLPDGLGCIVIARNSIGGAIDRIIKRQSDFQFNNSADLQGLAHELIASGNKLLAAIKEAV